ncbi:MAG TPA: patatin-like phospholipase family protein, partial [Candidatus Eisenbacteria bacterium]|nr:patatin-like phospholipase family protein [Candidatus Eisenbacteria bacterium]
MSDPRPRLLRDDLPFDRIAAVLSGGGALGAYEVGVLKVLETVGIRPSIIAGVSVGAINAVLWVSHGFRTGPLERVWSRLSPSAIGMRWLTLLGRMLGAFIMLFGAIQIVLTLAGSPELSPFRVFASPALQRGGLSGALLDALAW